MLLTIFIIITIVIIGLTYFINSDNDVIMQKDSEMAIWCKKCQTKLINGKCTKCGYEEEAKTYQVPKNKGVRKINGINQNMGFMIPCDICGEQIAVKATSCPHCGDTKSKNLFWKIIKIIGIIIAVIFILDIILASVGIAIFSSSIKEINKQQIEMIKNIPKFEIPKITIPKYENKPYKSPWQIKQEKITMEKQKQKFYNEQQRLREENKRLKEKNKLLMQMNN